MAKLNQEIWEQLEVGHRLTGSVSEFVSDFELLLDLRTQNLSSQIKQLDLEVEKEKSKRSQKLAQFVLSTLGSILPGTGGLERLLEDLVRSITRNEVLDGFPDLQGLFRYERFLDNVLLTRGRMATRCDVSQPYERVVYWDSPTAVALKALTSACSGRR